jgi:superfamily II DNA/RNA helicase
VLGISHVINYDVPDTTEAYTHRTGRTGRAARTGQAFSFVSREDSKMISLIEHNLGKKMLREVPPAFACEAEGDVREEKRRKFSRQMPRRKKPVTAGRGKIRRSRASSFDFGISKTVH